MLRRMLLCSMLVLVLAVSVRYVMGLASTVPSSDYLAAALRDQKSRCGRSLEVTYRQHQLGKQSPGHLVRYVRTPEVLFIRFDTKLHATQASFERVAHQFRSLTETPSGKRVGVVAEKAGIPLNTSDAMDPVLYRLADGYLSELVTNGKVVADMEDVDGHSCWVVQADSTNPAIARYVIRLDPQIGYCPRNIEILWANGGEPVIISFAEYKDVGRGVWFPMKIANRQVVNDPATGSKVVEIVQTADSVSIDKSIARESLNVQFPSGTQITHLDSQQ